MNTGVYNLQHPCGAHVCADVNDLPAYLNRHPELPRSGWQLHWLKSDGTTHHTKELGPQ